MKTLIPSLSKSLGCLSPREVDFPELVKIPIEPNQMATAVLSGNRIKFEYCSLDRAISPSGMASLRVFERAVWGGDSGSEDSAV